MKRSNWAIVIIIIIALGILVSLLVARQKAQARYIEKEREADSLSFVVMAYEEQIKAMVGIGEYRPDTLWRPRPPDKGRLPQDSVRVPPEPELVPIITPTITFDTTADFEWAGWGIGIKAEGKFYCDSIYSDSNSLKLYPTYWKRPPPPKPDILNIDPQLIKRIGFGAVIVNDYVGLSGRFDRFTIMAMKRLGSGWAAGANYEILRF